jgi:peptidoglycan/LPS O-acetylase OafA/YrhL
MGAASASAWASNFYFAISDMDYFSPDTETNLFLHTWSLGVEEQFYLVWPLLLVLALGAWTGAKRPPDPGRLKIVMLIVFGISFAACVWWTQSEPHMAFYMMPARAWQFALGALSFLYFGAATAAPRDGRPSHNGVTGNWRHVARVQTTGWIGLTMILLSALVLNARVPYPGVWALLPSIGTAVVLAAGARWPYAGVGRLLSLRPMQAIGRVSYTWYLWHWPVLLLGATVLDVDNGVIRCALVMLSFVLAELSYRLLETPIRRSARLLARPRLAVLAALALMIVANVMAVRWRNAALSRLAQPEQMRYMKVHYDAPVIYNMGCDDWYEGAVVHICAFGQVTAQHTAVVIGDSIGVQWFPAYEELFNKPGWRLLVITKGSCPMVDEPIFYARIGREYTECAEWRRKALQQVAELKPDIVILGSTFTYDFTQQQWMGGTTRVLRSIAATAGHIFIMRSTPVLPFDGPSCLAPRSWLYKAISSKSKCTAIAHDARSDNVYEALKSAASSLENASVVDMTDAVCPQDQCRAERDGVIVFRDSQHLTLTFAKSLAPVLAERLKIGEGLEPSKGSLHSGP